MTLTKIFILASLAAFIASCTPPAAAPEPDHVIYLNDGDSLSCHLVRGEILVTRVVTAEGDSLAVDNASIDRIVHISTGRDVTSRYIDREVLKIALKKKEAMARRRRLRADIAAGKRKQSELDRVPFAVLSSSLSTTKKGMPEVTLTILNLTGKKITLVRTRIRCFDAKGRPYNGPRGRDNVFDASSRIPIDPGEDFTTTLPLRNYPKTRKATVEIHYLEFSDRTWWKGKVEETVD